MRGLRASASRKCASSGKPALFASRRTGSAGVLRNGMLYARSAGLPVILHCEDHALATGVVHDGAYAALAGIPGSPASAEDAATATALVLAAETGAKVHITHVSTALSAAPVGLFGDRADVTAA